MPLQGDVDIVCGCPQAKELTDSIGLETETNLLQTLRTKQTPAFVDVIELIENVGNLVRFFSNFLGRYALGRLANMNYEPRMGTMAASSYGFPPFSMCVFIWGAKALHVTLVYGIQRSHHESYHLV